MVGAVSNLLHLLVLVVLADDGQVWLCVVRVGLSHRAATHRGSWLNRVRIAAFDLLVGVVKIICTRVHATSDKFAGTPSMAVVHACCVLVVILSVINFIAGPLLVVHGLGVVLVVMARLGIVALVVLAL